MAERSSKRRFVLSGMCVVIATAMTTACGQPVPHPGALNTSGLTADARPAGPKVAVNTFGPTATVSGVYVGSGDGSNMVAVGQWMNNTKIQWAGDYAGWNGPAPWQIEQWDAIGQAHVLWSMAFLPPIVADKASDPAAWLAEVKQDMNLAASGAYDQHWLDIAGGMASTSRQGKDAIRIGWELGEDWFPWGSRVFEGAGALQKQAWQHYAMAIRASGWQVKTVWDSEDSSTLPDPSLIDVVNTGGYDGGATAWAGCSAGGHNPDGTWLHPAEVWDCSEQGMGSRLQGSVDLARSIGKPLAISEWGLSSGNDDTYFVQAMHDFVVTHDVMFAIYFNNDNFHVSREMHDLDHFPKGKVLFRKLFTEP